MSTSASASCVEVDAPSSNECWKCRGAGIVVSHQRGTDALTRECPVCGGSGSLASRVPRKRKRPMEERFLKKGVEAATLLGPPIPNPLPSLEDEETEEWSSLTGKWVILQTLSGHRYSTDDVVTAWCAYRCMRALSAHSREEGPATLISSSASAPERFLDIGCGIGSVLLMNTWLFPSARVCVGVEAQPQRAALARRSAAANGVSSRVTVYGGDLRDPSGPWITEGPYPLITGTPPYFNVGGSAAKREEPANGGTESMGAASSNSSSSSANSSSNTKSSTNTSNIAMGKAPLHKTMEGALPVGAEEVARCLFEYRGGIEDYAVAAARVLAKPHGILILCESARGVERGWAAADAADLVVLARLDVIGIAGKPPLFVVFVMGWPLTAAAATTDTTVSGSSTMATSASYERERKFDVKMHPLGRWLSNESTFQPQGLSPYEDAEAASAAAFFSADGDSEDASAAASSSAAGDSGDAFAAASSSATSSSENVHSLLLPGKQVPSSSSSSCSVSSSSAAEAPTSTEVPPSAIPAHAKKLSAGEKRAIARKKLCDAFPGSIRGEYVKQIIVRGEDGERTPEYKKLLNELGKPGN